MDKEPATVVVGLEEADRVRISAQDQFDQVMAALPVALILADVNGRIESANRKALSLFGYETGEMAGLPIQTLVPERFRAKINLSGRLLTNMAKSVSGAGWDLCGRRKDNSEFPTEIDLNSIDLDGTPKLLASFIDITARLEGQKELARSYAELEEFAYVASHDLKAPLRAISHLVEWISEDIGAAADPATIENLQLLKGRAARLQLLLDGLLAYSRVGRTLDGQAEDVNMAELVEDVASILGPPSGFAVTYEGTLSIVRTSRIPLHVVLENLISNGIKHNDSPVGLVRVSASRVGDVVEFRVSDDGPGIPAQFHERVFGIFQTLASRDDVEGSGIGLAIVRKWVRRNGGEIWIESSPPTRGATFVFTWRGDAM